MGEIQLFAENRFMMQRKRCFLLIQMRDDADAELAPSLYESESVKKYQSLTWM